MGKSLIQQRRGKGTLPFLATRNRLDTMYAAKTGAEASGVLVGQILDLVKDSGRNSILADVMLENGERELIVAAEGVFVGQKIRQGKDAAVEIGNVLPLRSIPEGCPVFNIEKVSGDGGVSVKTGGSYALLVSKDNKKAVVKMPSGKNGVFPVDARATVGNISCGGRTEKPLIKAGAAYFAKRSKHLRYPTVRGVAMNPVSHPFGGAQHHPGQSKSTARSAPAGRKVGAIASRRTGRKKKL